MIENLTAKGIICCICVRGIKWIPSHSTAVFINIPSVLLLYSYLPRTLYAHQYEVPLQPEWNYWLVFEAQQ